MVHQVEIEGRDIRTPSSARFLLDGAISVVAASSFIVTFVQEVWSHHLNVKSFATKSTSSSVLVDSRIKID